MSLKAFHLLFITISVLLALGVGWWCLPENKGGAGLALVVALLLVGYETWFMRKMRSVR
jgi:phosphotransferase system  glucose/maltose/N-acetylglucosamine-specific IIC component